VTETFLGNGAGKCKGYEMTSLTSTEFKSRSHYSIGGKPYRLLINDLVAYAKSHGDQFRISEVCKFDLPSVSHLEQKTVQNSIYKVLEDDRKSDMPIFFKKGRYIKLMTQTTYRVMLGEVK
jgi:hypothetical protein